jgi:hypothetical protein
MHASPSSVPEKGVSEQRSGFCDQAEAETTSMYMRPETAAWSRDICIAAFPIAYMQAFMHAD